MRRIVLASHYTLVREGLALILRDLFPAPDLVLCVPSYAALRDVIASEPVDLILADPRLPDGPGLTLFQQLHQTMPTVPAVALTDAVDAEGAAQLLAYGAKGCIPRDCNPTILQGALNLILAGGSYLPTSALLRTLPPERAAQPAVLKDFRLSARQRQVLEGIRQGLSNRDIADRLGATETVVKNQVKSIMRLLRVRNRTQIALRLLEMEVAPEPSRPSAPGLQRLNRF